MRGMGPSIVVGAAAALGVVTACGERGGDAYVDAAPPPDGLRADGSTTATAPRVLAVSATTPDGAYRAGAELSLQVTFDEPVSVTGAPTLALETGVVDGAASYVGGSGSDTLAFRYVVADGDTTDDLDYAGEDALTGGTIRDADSEDAVRSLPAPGTSGSLAATAALVLDTTAPAVLGVGADNVDGTYSVGATLTLVVDFDEPVTVTGAPTLTLETGAVDGVASYVAGSGSAALRFSYVVAAGDASSDLDYAGAGALAGGALADLAGNAAVVALPAPGAPGSLGAARGIALDTRIPGVVAVTSPLPDGAYRAGTVIPVDVTFSEAVTVTGTPTLALASGAAEGLASYASGSGTPTLRFTYGVVDGDAAADLDYASAAALALAGGALVDADGNAASLLLPPPGASGSLAAAAALVLDTAAPSVLAVTSPTADGTYGLGAVIEIDVTFDEPVEVTGEASLALETGATAGSAALVGGGGTPTLRFAYVVGAGDASADLDYRSADALTGAVADRAGNPGGLALPAPGSPASLAGGRALVVDDGAVVLQLAVPPTLVLDVGVAATLEVTVSNASTAPTTSPVSVVLGGFDLAGGLGAAFETGSTCTAPLAPAASCAVTFSLLATVAGIDGFQVEATATPGGLAAATVEATAFGPACGPVGTTDCAASALVPGNAVGATLAGETFYRSYDAATDAYDDLGFPATVSDFRLDLYEVTVGRFRAFVEAGFGTRAQPPAAGSGAHATLPGSGWDSAWDANLLTDTAALTAALKCNATFETWTDTEGPNELRPITCLSWYEAMAFCTWDGGYLPTEAEWNYAAAGGSEQRAYPWSVPASSTTIDARHASYLCGGDGLTSCSVEDLLRPGVRPLGDGRWGHADLGGNVYEWTLDWRGAAYPTPCDDCAELVAATSHVVRGGAFSDFVPGVRTAYRYDYAFRDFVIGLRCARAP